MAAEYDIFLSYARKDAEAVRATVEALSGEGLAVWLDERDIESFQDITAGIVDGLGHSRAMVAYYSRTYLQRQACQWELTAALLALQNPAERQRRILVVNPEPEPSHIHPAELRGALYRRTPELGDTEGLRQLASEIAHHVGQLSGSLAVDLPLIRPRWLPKQRGSTRFVGRLEDLFRINQVLHGSDYPASSGDFGPGTAVLQGLGGIGKTMLVEEYGLRFGPAYPGGIFWLSAPGDGASEGVLQPAQLEADLLRQLGAIVARLLGQDIKGMDVDQLQGLLARELERRGESCLWVVDDLPSGLSSEGARQWFSPDPKARTLVTTRSHQYGPLAHSIELGVLSPEDAYELLTSRRRPEGEVEEAAAHELVEDLGRHALALDVAAATLRANIGFQSYAEFRAELANPAEDELEYAAELVQYLPREQASIATTLLRSVQRLDEESQDVLLLASCVAAEPMPPSFLVDIFKRADQLDEPSARRRVVQAVQQAESLSLLERNGRTGDCAVHRLVSRTMRYHDPRPRRREQLRAAAISVLGEELHQVGDVRTHARLAGLVPHARELTAASQTAEELHLLAWVARFDFERGAFASARSLQSYQLEADHRLLGEEHPETLTAAANLARTLYAQGDWAAARPLLEHALATRERVLGPDHPDTASSLNDLAVLVRAQGELRAARSLLERALAIRERVLGPDHPDTATSLDNLAWLLQDQGELAAAEPLYERALAIRERVLGADHPDTATSLNNLAWLLQMRAKFFGNAGPLYERALAIRERVLGPDHPDTAASLNNLGLLLKDQAPRLHDLGKLDAARPLLDRALEIRERVLGPEHPDTLVSLISVAALLEAQRERNAARPLVERALAISERVLGADHPTTADILNSLAVLLHAQGQRIAAQSLYVRALTINVRLRPKHPSTAIVKANLSRLRQGSMRGRRDR